MFLPIHLADFSIPSLRKPLLMPQSRVVLGSYRTSFIFQGTYVPLLFYAQNVDYLIKGGLPQ